MRRQDIFEGIGQILDAIDKSNIESALVEQIGSELNNPCASSIMLAALKKVDLEVEKFNQPAKQIFAMLDLHSLLTPTLWVKFVLADDKYNYALMLKRDISFTKKYLLKTIELIKQDTDRFFETAFSNSNAISQKMSSLSVIVFEDEDNFSTPTRLANVLESIDSFYKACALINSEAENTLSVVACDSGSDKSFDFLGIAKVMESVVNLIESLWERVVFYHENKTDERFKLIAKSLPLIEQIKKMEVEKIIEPERAEILKRNIFEGVNKFIESGASIPQIEKKSDYNPRSLLSPSQKLLVAAPSDNIKNNEVSKSEEKIKNESRNESDLSEPNLSNLNKEEITQLLKLLQKAKLENNSESDNQTDESNL